MNENKPWINPTAEQRAAWENQRRHCFAAYLLRTKNPREINVWLNAIQDESYREDMRQRLRNQYPAHREQKHANDAKAITAARSEDC